MSTNEMQDQFAETVINPNVSLINIQKMHESLYNEARKFGERMNINKQDLIPLEKKIDYLFSEMKELSSQMIKSGDFTNYNWLENITTDWQEIFSFILSEPRNIRDEIQLPARPLNLPRSQERSEIPYSRIKSNIEVLAYKIGERRKMAELKRPIQEYEKNPALIHQKFPSNETERKDDWNTATLYFALSVLTGGINLVYHLDDDAYSQLEKIYLGDVKNLSAYHKWQDKGENWELEEEKKEDYLKSCDSLNQILLDHSIKASAVDFSNIYSYLARNYFANTNLSPNALWKLTNEKAERIWMDKGNPQQSQKQQHDDWKQAEEFVIIFYSNIIPAILGKSNEIKTLSQENILNIIDWQSRKFHIVNCLEAAIVIYFFNPEFINCYIEKKKYSTVKQEGEYIKEIEYGIL